MTPADYYRLECPKRTLRVGHCIHEQRRDTYRGGDTTMVVMGTCCWCAGFYRAEYQQVSDPQHGPHAPKTLMPVDITFQEAP